MTNHTEALARVIGREIPFIVESDALATEPPPFVLLLKPSIPNYFLPLGDKPQSERKYHASNLPSCHP